MRRDDVRAFVSRDWDAVERAKLEYWAQSGLNAAARLAVADALRCHVRSLHADWPTEEERAEDLASHERISELLQRVVIRGR